MLKGGCKPPFFFMIIVCSLSDLLNVCESIQPKYLISVIDPGYAPETPKGVKNHLKLGFDDIIEISKELKCLVCDGQNIFESNSNFSKDIKMYIKKELNDGKKKEEIILDIHSKYGDSILMKPPVQLNTYLLQVIL